MNIIDQNPSVSKSDQLHVTIFQFVYFIDLRYIPTHISIKRLVIFLKSSTLTESSSNSFGWYVTNSWFSPFINLRDQNKFLVSSP
jgi:hypothetical protein